MMLADVGRDIFQGLRFYNQAVKTKAKKEGVSHPYIEAIVNRTKEEGPDMAREAAYLTGEAGKAVGKAGLGVAKYGAKRAVKHGKTAIKEGPSAALKDVKTEAENSAEVAKTFAYIGAVVTKDLAEGVGKDALRYTPKVALYGLKEAGKAAAYLIDSFVDRVEPLSRAFDSYGKIAEEIRPYIDKALPYADRAKPYLPVILGSAVALSLNSKSKWIAGSESRRLARIKAKANVFKIMALAAFAAGVGLQYSKHRAGRDST